MDPEAFRATSSGRPLKTRNGYWAFVPNELPPALSWSDDLVTLLSTAALALGELAGLGRTIPNPHLLVRPLMRREAVLSSRIEGIQASLADLYAYEAVQLSFLPSAPDAREVHNYVRALDYGLERLATLPISLRLIRELHARLMEGVRGKEWTPGEFRRSQNWIGPPGSTINTATYVPPPTEEMQRLLDNLEKFLHAPSKLPPLVRLALIHYQFEAIHPFLDGNGRVGRLLISLLLCAWQLLPQPLLYLSAYFEANRPAYYDHLLAVSQQGAWDAWLVFFLRGVNSQAIDTVQRIGRLLELRESYRTHFQTARAAARLQQVVDFLFERPIFTIQQLMESLNIAQNVAGRYVTQLEEAGILREITGQARNRIYRADEIMEAIEGPL